MTPGAFDSSEIRLYCDNDDAGPGKRWQLVPDVAGDPNPNSKRPAGKQRWWDHVNYIFRSPTTNGCKDKGTYGETYSMQASAKAASGQNPNRETITVCGPAYKRSSLR